MANPSKAIIPSAKPSRQNAKVETSLGEFCRFRLAGHRAQRLGIRKRALRVLLHENPPDGRFWVFFCCFRGIRTSEKKNLRSRRKHCEMRQHFVVTPKPTSVQKTIR